MKRSIMAVLIGLAIIGIAYAANFESITVSDTASGLTKTYFIPPDGYNNKALITCEGANIRFRLDGTAPTTTVGHILNNGDSLEVKGKDLLNQFKAIRDDATNATLRVTYYQEGE